MHETITIVSGLPRSGTSMMMRMLEAGGMQVAVDNIRKADEDNPMGYYELESVKKIKEDASWLDGVQGKVIKMVSMLLYNLPHEKNFNVVFMSRNMEEILASQRTMLQRKGQTNALDDKEMAESYKKHLGEIIKWLNESKNMNVLYLEYNNLIENPRDNAEKISSFLNSKLDVDKMVDVVDKSLYRQRVSRSETQGVTAQSLSDFTEMTLKDQEKAKVEEQLKSLGYM